MLEEFIEKDRRLVEADAQQRARDLPYIVLKEILDRVQDQKEFIDGILSTDEKEAKKLRSVKELITRHIENVAQGRICVVDYTQKAQAKQTVYVFVGTHWQKIESQAYYSFIRDCAIKMGLEDIFNADYEFMESCSQRFAYRVARFVVDRMPMGDVWINLMNCTLEVHSDGSITKREHRADDFFCYVLSYCYDEDAECPQWHAFLDKVMPEKEMQQLLAEYVGYCFTKDLKLEKMAVFYGTGSNGKSVTLDIIRELLGVLNVSVESLSALTIDDEKRGQIEGKLANISTESDGKLDFAKLKQMVSGEPITIRELYKGTRMMTQYAKFFTSFNTLPSTEYTYGYFRRWLLFPFSVTIPDDEQDVNLTKKLCGELSGILNWVLAALKELVARHAFVVSARCTEALNDYKRTANSAATFFHDKCVITKGAEMKLNELYNAYSTYCREEDMNRLGKKRFQEVIKNDKRVYATKSLNYIMYNIKVKEDD